MVDAGHFDSCFVTPASCETGFTAALWVDVTEDVCEGFGGLVTTVDHFDEESELVDDTSQGVAIYCRKWFIGTKEDWEEATGIG